MRIGLVLSLLAHASAGGAAWWLLGARGEAETSFPTLHVRSAMLAPVEPEPVADLELDVQSVEETGPAWAPDRAVGA